MYNNYTVKQNKKSNKPSMTLGDYSDINGLNAASLAAHFVNDETIKPVFNIRAKNYYHTIDLDKWVKNNADKIKRI